MLKNQIFSGKPILALVTLLIIWWIIPVVVKSFLRVTFYEFQAPVWSALSEIRNFQNNWSLHNHSKAEIIEAGKDLARLNAAYELRLQTFETLTSELKRLEKLLNLQSHVIYRNEVARVIRRDINSWWHQVIISKGHNFNIVEGAAVIYSGGVVGRIKEVHSNTSVVELVSDINFRIAAHIENDERPVIYSGSVNLVFSQPSGLVRNIPPDVSSNINSIRLVSSKLGGAFPDGLTIGQIENVKMDSNGLFQNGDVKLDQQLLSLEEVVVLLPINPEINK